MRGTRGNPSYLRTVYTPPAARNYNPSSVVQKTSPNLHSTVHVHNSSFHGGSGAAGKLKPGQTYSVVGRQEQVAPQKQESQLADSLSKLIDAIPNFDQLYSNPRSGFRDALKQVNRDISEQKAFKSAADSGAISRTEWTKKEEKFLEEISRLSAEVQDLQSRAKVPRSDKGSKDVTKYEKEIERLKKENEDLRKALESAITEKNHVLHRLSKVAGAKLSDNNPDITDLSDPNRPQKLAQMYNELYDNLHSEAMDSIKDIEDKGRARILLRMFADIWTFCKDLGNRQLSSLENLMLHPWLTTYTEPDVSQPSRYHTEVMKSIKDGRKVAAKETRKKLYQYFLHENAQYASNNKDVLIYTEACLDLCWFCAIQDPPIEFMFKVKEGSKIDDKYFRKYDRSGDIVEYLIWPAMLLHHEGPVLCRGIVQVVKKKK